MASQGKFLKSIRALIIFLNQCLKVAFYFASLNINLKNCIVSLNVRRPTLKNAILQWRT